MKLFKKWPKKIKLFKKSGGRPINQVERKSFAIFCGQFANGFQKMRKRKSFQTEFVSGSWSDGRNFERLCNNKRFCVANCSIGRNGNRRRRRRKSNDNAIFGPERNGFRRFWCDFCSGAIQPIWPFISDRNKSIRRRRSKFRRIEFRGHFEYSRGRKTLLGVRFFLVFLWILRKRFLRLKFPIYGKAISLNWQIYNIIFGIILSYFTGIIAINLFRSPTPKLLFENFQQLTKLVKEKKISIMIRKGSSAVAVLNNSFPPGSEGINFVENVAEALEFVKRDSTKVYVGLPPKNLNNFRCKLVTISDSSFPGLYAGIFYSKSAPKFIRDLPLTTVIAFRTMYEKYVRKYFPDLIDLNCSENPIKPLKIQQIASAFTLLFCGLALTAITFAAELLWNRFKCGRFEKNLMLIIMQRDNDRVNRWTPKNLETSHSEGPGNGPQSFKNPKKKWRWPPFIILPCGRILF